jgi:hypothetical protein
VDPVATPGDAISSNSDLPTTLPPTAYDKKMYNNLSIDALTRKEAIVDPLAGQPLSTQAQSGLAPTQAVLPDYLSTPSNSPSYSTTNPYGVFGTGPSQQVGLQPPPTNLPSGPPLVALPR